MSLREKTIRLAYHKPEIRPYILPLVSDTSVFRSKSARSWRIDVNRTSVDKARAYALARFKQHDKTLDGVWPDFERTYTLLQQKLQEAKNIPRRLMPVIERGDMDDFQKHLNEGHIDLFKPWALDQKWSPSSFSGKDEADKWITLGLEDGSLEDDKVRAKWSKISAKKLLPTQDQIWFDKLVNGAIEHGPVTSGSPVLNKTIIVSAEGYILDGHHRFSATTLADPSLGLKALYVPLDIDTLLEIGRSYAASQGNKAKN